MEVVSHRHSGHYCFLQHRGAQMTARNPRCCPQYHHHSHLVEGVPDAPIMVPAAKVVVQSAPENARELIRRSGMKMCLAAQMVDLSLLELDHAPGVRIELLLQIRQVGLFRWAAS